MATTDEPTRTASTRTRRGFAAWLFERRPERSPRVATEAVEEPAVEEPATEEAEQPAAPPERPEPPEQPTEEPEPATELAEQPAEQPAHTAGQPTDTSDEPDQPADTAEEPEQPKPRPRPSAAAPAIDDRPAADTAPDPGAAFFTRTGEDEREEARWARDAERDERRAKVKQGLGRGLRALRTIAIVVIVAVVAALLLRTYVVAPYYVPSASMEPTLHGCPGCNDDHVLVEKLSYRFHDVQAGDVVVFNNPGGRWGAVPDKVLIKRVIGVAGDQLVIKNGHVFRNGSELSEPYVNPNCHPATTGSPGSSSRAPRSFPVVPHGDVFVMGDNRCDSEDSRVFGVVPTSKIIGRAFMIVWPFNRIHSLSS